MIDLLLRHDIHINDISDHEHVRTPLLMILTSKEVMTKIVNEEKASKCIEFLLSRGAMFDAGEKDKEKIRRHLDNFGNKFAVQALLHSNPDNEPTPHNETQMSKKFKTSLEGEEKSKHMLGCCGY